MSKGVVNQIIRGTVVIVFIRVLAKFTAFISEAILASYLGTNAVGDAYYMVTNIQYVIYPMLSIGIWRVFLPLYKSHITKGQVREAHALADSAISFFTLASLFIVGLLILFAGPVVSVVAPGFRGQTRKLCIELVRISAPMYILITAAAIYASMLQCHNRFLGSQIREIASHIPTILAALFLYQKYGIRVLAIALVAGGALRLLVELPFVNWGYRYRPNFKFKTPEFILILKRLPSALISEAVTQLNSLVDKMMASGLKEGTISGLNYGHRLVNVFSGLLSTSIATALYPQMIELATKGEKDALSRLLVKIINIFSVLMIPVTLACVLFRTELVSAVYQRGSFDESSVALTSGVFALYSVGIFFIACNAVITNLFYGYGNTKTPMFFCIQNLVTNVVLNLVLISLWGVNGLALATSLSAVISFFIQMICAKRYITMDLKRILLTTVKVLAASALACGLPRLLFNYVSINKYATLAAAAVLGVGIYLCAVRILRITELTELGAMVRRKLRRRG